MDVEEEVILWVTSDLCTSMSNGATEVTMDGGTMSASAIPVTLISRSEDLQTLTTQSIDVIQYGEEEKCKTENKMEQNICIVAQPEEKISDVSGCKNKKPRRRGIVWNYFLPTTQDRAECTICAANISFKGKSTNNLLRHLRTKHKVSEESLKSAASDVSVCSNPMSLMETPKLDICPTTEADGSTYILLSAANVPGPAPDFSSNPTSDLTPNTSTDPASLQPVPSTPVVSSDEDVDEMLQYKRRGGVWKYFKTNVERRAAKCRKCSTLISYKGGSTTNLLRHMKSKHPTLKIPRKLNNDETSAELQYAYAEIVSECVKSDAEDEANTDGCNGDRLTIKNDDNITASTIIRQPKSDLDDYENPTEVPERKKSAVSWKYFTMENEDHGRCNTCNALISFKGGSTGNLIRHLKTKHAELDLTPSPKEETEIVESSESESNYEEVAFDSIENNELAKFVQLLNPKYKFDSGAPLPFLNETKEAPKRLLKRGVAFSYFEAVSEEHYKCRKCDAIVNLKNGAKAPLLRHLKSKHPHLGLLSTKNDGNVDEATQNDDGSSFDQNASFNLENIENIPVDGSNLTKDKMARTMRKRGLVWNYFAPLEDEKAKCITCPAVISYKRGSTSNLLRHMKKKHPHIDIGDKDYVRADEVNADIAESNDEDEDDENASPAKRAKLSTNSEMPKRIAYHKMLRKRGRVWNYFKPIAPDKAKCGLCNAIVIYLRGSTTNLWRHMKKKHLSIDLAKEKLSNKRGQYSPPRTRSSAAAAANEEVVAASLAAAYSAATDDADPKSPNSSANTGKTNAIYRRSEVLFRKHYDKFLNRPVSVTKSRLFDDQLAKMIVKQYCPFTIVESEKFRKFVQQVNPGYKLPSRKTISSRLIPELYEKCAQQVRDKLRNVRYVMVGMNRWTLSGNEKYILMVAHYIDESCTLHSSMLDCFRYDEEHPPEKLAAQIKTILSEWGLGEKLIAVVSDNAVNVAAAIQLHSWSHIPCFANMLNAVMNDGLQLLNELCNKVDFIIEHFRKNQPAMKKLTAALVEINEADVAEKVKSLKTEDPRHWQTTYDTFCQLLVCKTSLLKVDTFAESLLPATTLTDYEWHLMERLCAVLKPLVDATREISEKNVTISKVIPLSQGVSNYLKKTLLDEFLPKPLVGMVETMLNDVVVRFGNIEDDTILAEATFLDPRFKNHAFANQQSYANTYHSILQKAANLDLSSIGAIDNDQSTRGESAAASNGGGDASGNDIWSAFDLKVIHLNDMQNSETASVAEMENYLMETLPKRSSDPMIWWRNRRAIYPRLYECMKQRLCISATAVSTNLTNASQLVCEKRNKLSSCKVSMVLFLNQNL